MYVAKTVHNKDQALFDSEIQKTQDQLKNRISSATALLKGIKGMFHKDGDANRESFKNLVNGLELTSHFAGTKGVGYALNLNGVPLDTLANRLDADGIANFKERPKGTVPEYPIIYLEPSVSESRLVGYIASSDPVQAEAMQRAVATGKTAISGSTFFDNDPQFAGHPVFVIYVPVFYGSSELETAEDRESHLVGFVFAPILAHDMMAPTLPSDLDARVYVKTSAGMNLIYDSSKTKRFGGYVPSFTRSLPPLIEDQDFRIDFATTPAFDSASDRWLIPITAIAGILVSCLLFLFTNLEATARRRAQREAYDRLIAQRALGMSERRLRNLIEQAPLSIQVISPDGRTIEVNSGFEKLWGLCLKDLSQTNLLEHPYVAECGLLPYLMRAASGKPTLLPATHFDPSNLTGSGHIRWIAGSAYPLKDDQGRVREIVIMHQDLTDVKQKEEEIKRMNSYLEQRVEERTEMLAVSMAEMEAFSYSVAHDLRAPLRAMGSFARILMEDYSDKLDDEARSFLTRIVENSIHMGELIDGLLDLSRISRATLEKDDVDLSAMAEEIMRNIEKRQPTPWAKTRVQQGLRVDADSRLIHSALENLLDNAWKFSQKSEDALVEFGAEDRAGEHVFFVRDNGAGFDPSYIAKLFKPFERLHTGSEFPGTGIGLATVRRIIERHGGKVWAEGGLGKGATFYFTVPPSGAKIPYYMDEPYIMGLEDDHPFSASRGHLT